MLQQPIVAVEANVALFGNPANVAQYAPSHSSER